MADAVADTDAKDGPDRARLKRDYLDYLSLKQGEIKEQKVARRYYNIDQWTGDQIRTFNQRRQPVVTFDRVSRKINAVVGLLEGQRQDPKAYARTPANDQGAEIATAVIRYVLDEQAWKEKSPQVALDDGIDAIGGIEIVIERGDEGDPEIGLEVVEPSSFFYDPRSIKGDFSDARYMGISKWADLSAVIEMFPDREDDLRATPDNSTDLTTDPASDVKWDSGDGERRKIRLVDHWYIENGQWQYCIYTAGLTLAHGESYLLDEKQQTICKYIMCSANVDQDGDRYGFVRGMKSAQDELNQRHSKGLHILNTRRVIVGKGMVDDIEKFRQEAVKPDGVLEYTPIGGEKPEFDDARTAQEMAAHLELQQAASAEIENYGFNPALIGGTSGVASGRALQIQQQAGIAELGPFILGYKGWKLRLYRAIWNAIQQHWTAQRWIRVTHNPALQQVFGYQVTGKAGFIPLNTPMQDQSGAAVVDPQTGQQKIANSLGALDVDLILDEGPDEITMQSDLYDTIKQVLPSIAPMMTPAVAQAAFGILISSSPLPPEAKEAFEQAMQAGQQPDPAKQMGMQLELQSKQAQNAKTIADAHLSMARAQSEGAGDPSNPNAAAEMNLEWRKAVLNALTQIEVARITAKTDTDSAILDAKMEALLGLGQMGADQQAQLRDQAHQIAMAQMQAANQPAQTQPPAQLQPQPQPQPQAAAQ